MILAYKIIKIYNLTIKILARPPPKKLIIFKYNQFLRRYFHAKVFRKAQD